MAEISNGYFEFGVGDSEVIFEHKGVNIGIPEKPWMPTRAGIEVRVWGSNSDSLVEDKIGTPDLSSELLRVGKVTMISAEVAGIFSEADDPKNPDWYDKPWFNLNFNSHLGDN